MPAGQGYPDELIDQMLRQAAAGGRLTTIPRTTSGQGSLPQPQRVKAYPVSENPIIDNIRRMFGIDEGTVRNPDLPRAGASAGIGQGNIGSLDLSDGGDETSVHEFLTAIGVAPDVASTIVQLDNDQQRIAIEQATDEYFRRQGIDPTEELNVYRQKREIDQQFRAPTRDPIADHEAKLRLDQQYDSEAQRRDAFISQFPANQQAILRGLNNSDLSDLAMGILEAQRSGRSMQYQDRKDFPRLKILQDEAFQRSGLKPGDTVCIRV